MKSTQLIKQLREDYQLAHQETVRLKQQLQESDAALALARRTCLAAANIIQDGDERFRQAQAEIAELTRRLAIVTAGRNAACELALGLARLIFGS